MRGQQTHISQVGRCSRHTGARVWPRSHPVGKTAGDPAFTELTKKDLKWATLDYTNVESQSFYFFTDEGRVGFVQLIYSNVA
jgi:hypothetical protein